MVNCLISKISDLEQLHTFPGRPKIKMHLKETQRIELPPVADMHVHLRQGDMMKLVTPTIRDGGVDTVFVMASDMEPQTVRR